MMFVNDLSSYVYRNSMDMFLHIQFFICILCNHYLGFLEAKSSK